MKRVILGFLLFLFLPFGVLYGTRIGIDYFSQAWPQVIFQASKKVSQLYEDMIRLCGEACGYHGGDERVIGEYIRAMDIENALVQDLDINKIPLEFADKSFSAENILQDSMSRVSEDFKVPPQLKNRVAFWFDIYTKYSSRFSVIHDVDRPWIIYKVVDLRPIYAEPTNIFQKDIKDKKAVAKALVEVRRTLQKLARRRSYKNLSADEERFFKLLADVPGTRRNVFRKAAANVRSQRGQKNYMRQGIAASSKYIREMEEIFARYDLPVELVRLPLVESSFNEEATSKVGASGIWQFMVPTGKLFLKVSETIDERNSPLKATEAAARLMMSNFKLLKSWPLAVTAYNHGAGSLIKASKKYGTKDLWVFIDKHNAKSFGFASENFYCEFLAALHAETYQEEIFGMILKHPPLAAEEVVLKSRTKVGMLVDLLAITLEEIKLYNPDLKNRRVTLKTVLPPKYRVRLPVGRKARLEMYYQQADDGPSTKMSKKGV